MSAAQHSMYSTDTAHAVCTCHPSFGRCFHHPVGHFDSTPIARIDTTAPQYRGLVQSVLNKKILASGSNSCEWVAVNGNFTLSISPDSHCLPVITVVACNLADGAHSRPSTDPPTLPWLELPKISESLSEKS
jgi:hypothetical protein